ncbi:apolipoprotein N-acyltransferase [Maritimibacter dapengensis]|uniref:Apolipoprotein N-acyltransferase n=1 Tax=Maritimibacter dapengensis TaxID=2836868 RepID=A0ABS6SZY8_9RHOB|nr:apolipoprotein N-acyltransferase [Maritimibacter dapengensis]MBV7378548.1 apolipoprotein N-acyltransferase [Maritimibacter dapengensis]
MANETPRFQRTEAWLERQHEHFWRVFALSASAGVLAGFGQAPFGAYPLTFIGLALGAALIQLAPTGRRALLTGWALGLGYFALTFVWIVQPFLVDIGRHGWMAPFALLFLSGGMALYWAGAAWLAKTVAGKHGAWVALGAAFGLAEMLRGWLFGGFPWGGPGLIWIDTPLAQLARLTGVYGLSALTVALGAALWPAMANVRRLAIWFGSAAVLVALAVVITPRDPGSRDATVRLVQPYAPQHLKWDPDHVMGFFDRAVELTQTGGTPDLVIWPETSIPAPLGRAPGLEEQAAAAAFPAPLIAGIQRVEGRTWRNSLVMYDGPGTIGWVYDKHHLVPFGEYVPLGDLAARFGINGLAAQDGAGYASGPGPVLRETPVGTVLPLICYEMIFARDIRDATGRPDWILQSTNDAWFGTFSGPQQHLVQARFRAIEFGLPIARAANTGVSAMIDARGSVTAKLPLGAPGVVDAPLPMSLPVTVYARAGDLPLLVLSFGLLAALFWRNRRNSVDPTPPGG